MDRLTPGQIVLSLAGHDSGTLYVVLRREGERFLLADGRNRKLHNPKRKNGKHLERRSDSPLADAIGGGVVTDRMIRNTLAACRREMTGGGNSIGKR